MNPSKSEVIFFPDTSLDKDASKLAKGMQYKSILAESRPLKQLCQHLKSAKTSIDVCLFLITSHTLADAVTERIKKKGVKVRLILDEESVGLAGMYTKRRWWNKILLESLIFPAF